MKDRPRKPSTVSDPPLPIPSFNPKMACNHHQTHLPPSSCCSCVSSFSSLQTHCRCHSSPSAFSDSLLQAVDSGGFLSSPMPQCAHGRLSRHRTLELQHRCGKQQQFHQQEAHFSVISFLLGRIEAMESSLRKLHSSPSPSFRCLTGSLREAAARTIQFHFRAFLVRRSQTLRQLKDLALVKSSLSSIKSSLFNENRVGFEALSLKIMDLLLILDTVQDSDPMISDSKRSISRDLVQFLELIGRKRDKLFSKATSNSRFNKNICRSKVVGSKRGTWDDGNQKEAIENLRSRIEKIRGLSRFCEKDEEDVELKGFKHGSDEEDEEYCGHIVEHDNQIRGTLHHKLKPQSEVKTNVRFAESENLSPDNRSRNQPMPNPDESSLDESDCSDDHMQLAENLCNEIEEIKGFSSPRTEVGNDNEERDAIDSGRSRARNVTNGGNGRIRAQNRVPCEGFVFSAPLPVKMEDKADQVKKRKALKVR